MEKLLKHPIKLKGDPDRHNRGKYYRRFHRDHGHDMYNYLNLSSKLKISFKMDTLRSLLEIVAPALPRRRTIATVQGLLNAGTKKVDLKETLPSPKHATPVEELELISLRTPNMQVSIDTKLGVINREKLIKVLQNNADVFA